MPPPLRLHFKRQVPVSEMLFSVLGSCCHPHLHLDTFLIAGGNKCPSNITSPLAPFNKNAKLYKAFKIPSESEKNWNRSWSWNRIDLHWFPNENQFNYFSWCIASRQASNSISTSIISTCYRQSFFMRDPTNHKKFLPLALPTCRNAQACHLHSAWRDNNDNPKTAASWEKTGLVAWLMWTPSWINQKKCPLPWCAHILGSQRLQEMRNAYESCSYC